jgi:polysaccharide biosynthesis transport protein
MEQNPTSLEFAPVAPQENSSPAFLFAWRRKGLIVFFLIVGLGLGYLHFLRQVPVYQSATEILIVDQEPKLPIEGVEVRNSSGDMHAALISSQAVIVQAVEDGGLGQLPGVRASGNAVGVVMSGLSVSVKEGGGHGKSDAIIRLSFTSANREECPKILNAVVDAYQEFLGESHQNISKETSSLIEEAKDQLDRQISESEKTYREFRDKSPLLVVSGEASKNVHEARLQAIEAVRSSKVLEISELKAKIDAITAAIKRGASREALNLMVGHIEDEANRLRQGPQQTVEGQLFPLMLDEQILLGTLGADHPDVLAIRRRIELTRKHLLGGEEAEEGETTEPFKQRDYYQVYLESTYELIKMNEQTIAAMDELFAHERESAKALSSYQVGEETLRSEIDRKTRLFDVVLKRLEEINLVKDRGSVSVRSLHPAGLGFQIKPDLQSSMLTAGVLALMCGLGLAFIVDKADRRFRNPDEIRNDLGIPVIGHIPVISLPKKSSKKAKDETAMRPELKTIHSPRGRIAEAYRAVRTAVYFNTRGSDHQVIQVTSPNPGDGKSTLIANLAISIANSGKTVLLIDADFRRPRCHRLFNADNQAGMSCVIDGKAEISDVVQETAIENLSLLTCGTRPKNPSELLTSRRFEELLALFRDQYDIVLIDTPPVLPVTDPLNVAPRVDAVLVVLKLTKSARSAASRTLDALESVGANVLGVVVNGVEGNRGHSGYNSAQYNYTYSSAYGGYGYESRYGYGYGYLYGRRDGENGSYYVDDDAESEKKVASPVTDQSSSHKNNGKH